jgi:hypothetical protein
VSAGPWCAHTRAIETGFSMCNEVSLPVVDSMSNPLVGTWKLVSCEYRRSNGDVSYPWGSDAEGYIMYSEDGHMSVVIMSANRSGFTSDDIKTASVEEKGAAYDGYLSYCGTYDFQGDRVIHKVQLSLFPNWTGTDLVRFVKFEGNRLILTSPPMISHGTHQTARVVWEHA